MLMLWQTSSSNSTCPWRVAAADADGLAFGTEKLAAEAPPAVDRDGHLHLGDMAGITVEIRMPHQRPVDAGRRNLQLVRALDRVRDIEHRR